MREIQTACPACGSQNLLITSTTCTADQVTVQIECLACDTPAQVVVAQLRRRVVLQLPEAQPQAPLPVVLEHSETQQQRDLLQEGLAANAVPSVSDVLELSDGELAAEPIAMLTAPGPLTDAGRAAPVRWLDRWGAIAGWQFFRRGSSRQVACEHCGDLIPRGEQCAWVGREQSGDGRGHSMHWECYQHLVAELDQLHESL